MIIAQGSSHGAILPALKGTTGGVDGSTMLPAGYDKVSIDNPCKYLHTAVSIAMMGGSHVFRLEGDGVCFRYFKRRSFVIMFLLRRHTPCRFYISVVHLLFFKHF